MIPPAAREGTTTTTSAPLYWREDGTADAPPLLLLHGGPGAHHDYLYPQCLALAARHRLVTYDQRGGGRSKTDDPAPVTWQTQVADCLAVARERDTTPLTLVGYSWGALLAMLTAIELAGASAGGATSGATARSAIDTTGAPPLARLVLISPAPVTRTWRGAFERDLAERQRQPAIADTRAELARAGLRDRDPAAYRQRAFELSVAGYFADPARSAGLTPFRVTGKVQQSVWASLGDFDLRPALASVRVPTLVVHGRQDPIPLASAEAAARALDAEFVPLDDCGHVPYVEAPDALFGAIDAFLARTAD